MQAAGTSIERLYIDFIHISRDRGPWRDRGIDLGRYQRPRSLKNSMEGSDCLSVKIRISYNTSEELQGVIRLLHPVIKSCKVAKNKDGRYKKAYVELKCE